LKDYTLGSGHCSALAEVWKQLGKPKVNVVYLDNCGIDDDEFTDLLDGLLSLKSLRMLFYKESVFGDNALNGIKPLLEKKYPNNLRILRFVKLSTSD
jgi:hypothetical protein